MISACGVMLRRGASWENRNIWGQIVRFPKHLLVPLGLRCGMQLARARVTRVSNQREMEPPGAPLRASLLVGSLSCPEGFQLRGGRPRARRWFCPARGGCRAAAHSA